jgi:glucose/arabinose dehydrogenase
VVVALLALGVALFGNRARELIGGISLDTGQAGVAELHVPDGFTTSVYAQGLGTPRLMATAGDTVYVAEWAGRVSALRDGNGDGDAEDEGERVNFADGLRGPNSVAVLDNTLLVGEQHQVSAFEIGSDGKAGGLRVLIPDLPTDGSHQSKTVLVGPGGKIYLAMGSSCNVCDEGDERRAAVSVYNSDGTGGRVYTRGLRNAVGLAVNPWTGEIWATNNGRDLMGDDTPPETVNVLGDGLDYGWPRCHAGDIVDPDFGKDQGCQGVAQPIVEMQAHMAPLGLAFYREGDGGSRFPEPYSNSLYIDVHGSWNRSSKVGYAVYHVPLKDGKVAGGAAEFVGGFLRPDGSSLGRPAGVAVAPDGSLLVSDDKGGFIYRVAWSGNR